MTKTDAAAWREHRALDLAHIRTHVRQCSEMLEAPELFETLDRMLKDHAAT